MPYLYHATDIKNIDSIKRNGLLTDPPAHAFANEIGIEALKGKIFLAFDAEAALSYAECSDDEPEDIAILKIRLESLHKGSFDYDWNNKCEYRQDINSCVYTSDIPPQLIEACDDPDNEPPQDLFTFKDSELFEKIDRIFYEEVATNLEDN